MLSKMTKRQFSVILILIITQVVITVDVVASVIG